MLYLKTLFGEGQSPIGKDDCLLNAGGIYELLFHNFSVQCVLNGAVLHKIRQNVMS